MSLSVYSLLNYPQVTKYTNYYNQEKYIFSKVVSIHAILNCIKPFVL